MAEDIADWLEQRSLGTKGVDIHQSFLRDEPDDAVLLIEGGGEAPDRSHDSRRVLNPAITVVVRAAPDNYVSGYERARSIFDALLDLMHTSINGNDYKGTVPVGDVSDLGRDEKDRYKWSMIFVVKKS